MVRSTQYKAIEETLEIGIESIWQGKAINLSSFCLLSSFVVSVIVAEGGWAGMMPDCGNALMAV